MASVMISRQAHMFVYIKHSLRYGAASVLFGLCLAGICLAENQYPIQWEWRANPEAARVQNRFPWIKDLPERVNLSISHDGGTNYALLASGVPSRAGTNTWMYTVPDAPSSLAINARVRVESLPSFGQPFSSDARNITIAGLHLVNPPDTVSNGQMVTLRWVCAGAGPIVQLGTRVVGADEWVSQAVFLSADSSGGSITNTSVWYVDGLQAVPTEIILQSMSDPLVYRRHTLEVLP